MGGPLAEQTRGMSSHFPDIPGFLMSHQRLKCLQFDSLVQTAMGFNHAEAQAYALYQGHAPDAEIVPKTFPMQALDHAAGYLLAFGINAALCKTITVILYSLPISCLIH